MKIIVDPSNYFEKINKVEVDSKYSHLILTINDIYEETIKNNTNLYDAAYITISGKYEAFIAYTDDTTVNPDGSIILDPSVDTLYPIMKFIDDGFVGFAYKGSTVLCKKDTEDMYVFINLKESNNG